MPKSTQKIFSSKKLTRLIKLVEQNPVLYDSSHPFNNDTSHKNLLWENIAEELNSEANVLKKQWKILSYDYVKKSKETTKQNEALAFLSNFKERRISSTIENEENNNNNNNSTGGLSSRELSAIKEVKELQSDFAPGPTPQNTPSELTSISKTIRVLRPRRSEPTTAGFSAVKRSSTGTRKRTNNNHVFNDSSNDHDANFAFFESMALTVALFPQHLQASVKMRICNLVNETEVQLSLSKTD